MATVADLLELLDFQTRNLSATQAPSPWEAHAAGWMVLARPMLRANPHLGLAGRVDHLNGGLTTVLLALADGPRRPLDAFVAAPQLTEAAIVYGTIADILSHNARFGPGQGLGGSEAVKLEASLLAQAHILARWSATSLPIHAPVRGDRLGSSLGALARIAEPWALIPPNQRASILDYSRVPTNTAPGLDGAIAAWVEEATQLLGDRYRLGSWAMQSIAGTIALLSQVTAGVVDSHRREGRLSEGAARAAGSALAESVRCWSTAARWPPHLRLGGKNREFRRLANDLRDECLAKPVPRLSDLHHALALIEPVAGLHATVMGQLVTHHELWVHGPALGKPGGDIQTWIREPWWSGQGMPLLRASDAGVTALHVTLERMLAASLTARGERRTVPVNAIEAFSAPRSERERAARAHVVPGRPHGPSRPT